MNWGVEPPPIPPAIPTLVTGKMRRTTVESLTAGTDRLSEMLSPRGQNFGLSLGLGLKAVASASALASSIWPRPGLGLQQKNQQPRRNRRTNLFALYRLQDITL